MKNQNRAYIFALSAVMLWSTVASAFKIALRLSSHIQLLMYSSVISAILMFVIVAATGRLKLLRQYNLRELAYPAMLGVVNPFLYYLVLFKAYSVLPAQEAMSLNYSWPVMLVLLSIPVLRQKVSLKSIIATGICFAGIVIIITKGDFFSFSITNPGGTALAVGSSVIWAMFWLLQMRDKHDAIVRLFVSFFTGAVCSVIFTALVSEIRFPAPKTLAAFTYIGFFEMGITFVLWQTALKLSETTAKVSQLIFLSPFFSLILIQLVLKEKILVSTMAGVVFIIGGIILEQAERGRKKF